MKLMAWRCKQGDRKKETGSWGGMWSHLKTVHKIKRPHKTDAENIGGGVRVNIRKKLSPERPPESLKRIGMVERTSRCPEESGIVKMRKVKDVVSLLEREYQRLGYETGTVQGRLKSGEILSTPFAHYRLNQKEGEENGKNYQD